MASGGAWIYDKPGLRFAGCRRLRDVAGAIQAQGMIGAIRSIDPKWAGDTDPGGKRGPVFHIMPMILGGPTLCMTGVRS